MSTAAALVTSFPSVRISRYSGRYNSHTTNAALCAAWLCAVVLCYALLLCMPFMVIFLIPYSEALFFLCISVGLYPPLGLGPLCFPEIV